MTIRAKLGEFSAQHGFKGKGPLSLALVITVQAAERGLPLDADTLLTASGGQVAGMGVAAVQSILARHGITKVLAREGGRTSRGSVGKMKAYAEFLNSLEPPVDFGAIEAFWIERVLEYFAAKPFRITLDSSLSLRNVVSALLSQAEIRQRESPGTQYAGAMLQHLVGAKLECALGRGSVSHNSFTTADSPGARAGDFLVGDVAIHVTMTPTEHLINRCQDNIESGLRPVIVTVEENASNARYLAGNQGMGDRIDVFDAQQFLAANLYELGRFQAGGRATALADLAARYNEIVSEFETDPSMRIDLQG